MRKRKSAKSMQFCFKNLVQFAGKFTSHHTIGAFIAPKMHVHVCQSSIPRHKFTAGMHKLESAKSAQFCFTNLVEFVARFTSHWRIGTFAAAQMRVHIHRSSIPSHEFTVAMGSSNLQNESNFASKIWFNLQAGSPAMKKLKHPLVPQHQPSPNWDICCFQNADSLVFGHEFTADMGDLKSAKSTPFCFKNFVQFTREFTSYRQIVSPKATAAIGGFKYELFQNSASQIRFYLQQVGRSTAPNRSSPTNNHFRSSTSLSSMKVAGHTSKLKQIFEVKL
ncbi:hypothetical protein B0H19DRAFT_1084282 [Mycena capillaripes]|nr:hypothetical protein B0H19DRAFT_1084282 [Mycena capillaripes]